MKYIAKSPNFKGDIVFGFDDDGFLTDLNVNAKLSEAQWHWLRKDFPVTLSILKLLSVNSTLVIEELVLDLCFAAFWDAYKYKVGKKDKAEKLWNLMPDNEKQAALLAIPRYHYFLATKPNMDQAHAETWLRNRRWEDELIIKK